jgi:hypothetical protein
VGWTGEQRLQSINFDVVSGGGQPLSVEQAKDSSFGVIGAYTKGATTIGSERIGALKWDVYSQPSVGGVVYVHTYPDGVEVAVFGGRASIKRKGARVVPTPGAYLSRARVPTCREVRSRHRPSKVRGADTMPPARGRSSAG